MSTEVIGDQITIIVQDNGIGIPENVLDQVFDMFTQLNRVEGSVTSGLGIGLTLVKSLVELHDGTISVESEGTGKGTRITVSLPLLKRGQSAAASVQQQEPVESDSKVVTANKNAEPKVKLRILVVDDNHSAARTLSMLLKLGGHDVSTANDGQQAVDTAQEIRPEVIFMDLGMPVMDGLQAARLIRQQPWSKQTTMIALSGWGSEEDKRKSQQAGFNHHVAKPASSDAINAILKDHLKHMK